MVGINYLTAIKITGDSAHLWAVSSGGISGGFALLTLHVEVKLALLSAVCLGYGIMVIWYLILLLKYFPRGKEHLLISSVVRSL